jgi:hypothetical protein
MLLPRGYCTWTCYFARRRPKRPEEPQLDSTAIRLLLTAHRKEKHKGDPWMVWHVGCEECERLEKMLVEALAEVA